MQTLILPGYSASNKEWVDETAKSLKVEGTIRPFYWMHWTDETSIFNAQEKAKLLQLIFKLLQIKTGKLVFY